MTHADLIAIGFWLHGVEENDPFYRLTFEPPGVFGFTGLSGQLNDHVFDLHGNEKSYTDPAELLHLITVLGARVRRREA